jgi:hypothetical protein
MEKTCSASLASRCRPRRGGVGGRTPFKGADVLFRGGDVEEVREWAAQCHGMTPAFPHSAGDGRTVRVGRTAPRYDSQAVSEGWCGKDSPLTRAPMMCRSI